MSVTSPLEAGSPSTKLTVNNSTSTKVKGTGLHSSRNWARQRYESKIYQRILEAIDDEYRELVRTAFAPSWYPLAAMESLWSAVLAVAHDGDPVSFERAMYENGRYIAEDNLGTVYRVYLTLFASPRKLFMALPQLWGTYFSGIGVELDTSTLDECRGVCRVTGLGELRHVAPAASGWIAFALDTVGATAVHIDERNYRAGRLSAMELIFDISWRA